MWKITWERGSTFPWGNLKRVSKEETVLVCGIYCTWRFQISPKRYPTEFFGRMTLRIYSKETDWRFEVFLFFLSLNLSPSRLVVNQILTLVSDLVHWERSLLWPHPGTRCVCCPSEGSCWPSWSRTLAWVPHCPWGTAGTCCYCRSPRIPLSVCIQGC